MVRCNSAGNNNATRSHGQCSAWTSLFASYSRTWMRLRAKRARAAINRLLASDDVLQMRHMHKYL